MANVKRNRVSKVKAGGSKPSIPGDAVRRPDNHLAEGESTGHFHDATGVNVATFSILGSDALILDSPMGSTVTHQEHGPVRVEPGLYDVTRVREFDHFTEEARAVED